MVNVLTMGSVLLAGAIGFLSISLPVSASEPYQDYRKRIESSQNITALNDGLFGDVISLYNGKTEFSVTDIDIQGNNALAVRLHRRFNVELSVTGTASSFNAALNGAGGWDVDVPYISATIQGASWSSQRCSVHIAPSVSSPFSLVEVWQGNTIHIPGSGDRTMLGVEANTPVPADGVSRKWTTSQRDAIDCIPMVSGLSGEGYRVTTTAGDRYYFNVSVSKYSGTLEKMLGMDNSASISRNKIYFLATKVEDRFGNVVNYQYDADGHVTRIWSSDGREINATYNGGNIVSATANGRTWNYGYTTVEGQARLQSVTQPDGSRWSYGYSSAMSPSYVAWDGNSTSNCLEQPPEIPLDFVITMTHPSGATGRFAFSNSRHYRSGIHMSQCTQRITAGPEGSTYYYELTTPNFFDVMSLYKKEIGGPGVASPQVWSYSYGGGVQTLWGSRNSAAVYPCTTCASEKEVVVTNPDATKIKYRYGFLYALNEGRLLGSSVLNAAGQIIKTSTTTYMTTAQTTGQSFASRFGLIYNGDDPSTAEVRPVISEVTQQNGVTFSTVNNTFDAYARPTSVTRSSALTP